MGRAFERVVIVMMENSTRENVLANTYMSALRKKGVYLSNALGVTHSSQPNYIVSVSGDSMGFIDDSPGYAEWIYSQYNDPQPPMVTTIADLLEAQGLTWKNYAQSLPPGYVEAAAAGYATDTIPPDIYPFARKHVPFLSFGSVMTNPARYANIVGLEQFETDLTLGQLPEYSWVTPDLLNDGHDLKPGRKAGDPGDTNRHPNIVNIAEFLEVFLGPDPVSKFPPGTLIIVTFDEAYPYWDPYEIYTLLIGDMLQAGTTRTEPYNHYSMLRSIEVNFETGSLKRNDSAASPYWFLE